MNNRKKIRGWKRQVARVERWRDAHRTPDLDLLERHGREYAKLTIDPWYRLVRRQPPMWLRRHMTHALLDVHESWRDATRDRPDVAYSHVWLCWPHFIDSQVVMATPGHAQGYERLFVDAPHPKGFPVDLGEAVTARLRTYEWRECLDETPVWSEGITPELQRWLSRQRVRTERLRDGTFVSFVQRGRVWVGRHH